MVLRWMRLPRWYVLCLLYGRRLKWSVDLSLRYCGRNFARCDVFKCRGVVACSFTFKLLLGTFNEVNGYTVAVWAVLVGWCADCATLQGSKNSEIRIAVK